jgi:excisionase family DNA binding protein
MNARNMQRNAYLHMQRDALEYEGDFDPEDVFEDDDCEDEEEYDYDYDEDDEDIVVLEPVYLDDDDDDDDSDGGDGDEVVVRIDLISVPEAAEIVGVSPQTIRNRIYEGVLPAAMIATRYVIQRDDLELLE